MSAGERTVVRTLGGAAAVLALLAAAVGAPRRAPAPLERVGARQLAAWIRDGRPGLRVLDLRGDPAFGEGHVPSAEPASLDRLDALRVEPTETVVVYSTDAALDSLAARLLSARGAGRVLALRGGARAWGDEVLAPTVSGDSAAYVAALSRYFGGRSRVARDSTAIPESDAARGADAHSTRDSEARGREQETDVFGTGRRRGC
jgi:rhodanese-related sulfurtransferase